MSVKFVYGFSGANFNADAGDTSTVNVVVALSVVPVADVACASRFVTSFAPQLKIKPDMNTVSRLEPSGNTNRGYTKIAVTIDEKIAVTRYFTSKFIASPFVFCSVFLRYGK